MSRCWATLAVLLALASPARALPPPVTPARWDALPLDAALAEARASKRWVLVDVFATWCGPCHEMDEKVYSRADVVSALQAQFVMLRRDGESGDGLSVAEKYHVVGFPTLLVLDDSGAEVDRLMGFIEGKELLSTLDDMRHKKGTLADLEQRLKARPRDEALRLDVATRHAMRGDARAPAELEAVARADAQNKAGRAAPALLVLGKYYWLRGAKNYTAAFATLDNLRKTFPHSKEAEEAPYHAALALHGAGKTAEARALLDEWLAAAPKDLSRYSAYAWACFKQRLDLARGVEVAQQGLAIDDKDDGLWDTLAELYAAQSKPEAAQAATRRALQIKPKDAYYLAQLRRFGGK